ncbi:PREDICTED: HEAT repeat-containing protein 5B isoform X4 [Lupinus angustifolius]|uniref:HEAT repeat-containing protein 5B isoform X4 n=1 Tax=Lupinus angustifolius TaxID=3871 RepID=UPI00092EC02C|nr:PREDICTED: HEAT repeat-containing protein 5B isoform X4 [Lupinus angustifolius]
MAKKYNNNINNTNTRIMEVPLSRFGVLVAQLESIVASAPQQPPDQLLCFDLLSDLISAIDQDTKDSIMLWQRRCEDALYSLLVIGVRRPVRHLASVAMTMIISKGDTISIYSRASSLQGFLSDGKKSEPLKVAGVAQCLGELYKHFGRRITSGLLETTTIAAKLLKFSEEFVRRETLHMLQNALEGSGGSAASTAYTEAFRLITRSATGDKSFSVRIAAARCLKAFASIGGPGLTVAELDNSASYCVKALEDPVSSVRDAFAEALGSLLALGMNPEAQVQPRGKGPNPQPKKLEGGLQKHLVLAFRKASGVRSRDVRVGLTLSWVFFLQAIRIKYMHPDTELQNFALQVMEMLHADATFDAHASACVLYILRVGITDQMTEPTQRSFLVFLGKQLESPELGASMKVAALRTLSYTLKTLGEVPLEFKEVLDSTVVAAVSHSSKLVRIEAALALRALAEVDPPCVGGLTSYGVTALAALRESISFEKGGSLQFELDSLHGQATVLAALVSISPKLPLGYPARFPSLVLGVSKKMLTEHSRNPVAAIIEKEAGWFLLSSLLASLPKEDLEAEVFDILSLWATLFTGDPENEVKKTEDFMSRIHVWSAAIHALTAFIRCFISPDLVNEGVLLQPVLTYLSRALSYISVFRAKEISTVKPAVDIFIIRTLIAYQSIPDPLSYKNDHPQIIEICTFPFRHASGCEESSCLRLLLDKRDAWLGPWTPGRDWFEDELRAFQGGKDGLMPCVWENEFSSFPQPETISKTLVNQMLLSFGIMFASQDSAGMLSLLGIVEQCLKSGKKQNWRARSVTNICVSLLAGFKALLSFRSQTLGQEILGLAQSIFQSILAEGDICASQRRASSEGLGYLARVGNDIFTARMTRSLLADLNGASDFNYAGSIALALGCIHRSAGGIALSTLVPATVSSISTLAKSSVANLQIWSMHGLLLTIEAAGLSFVSHVQATLGLAMDILLSDDNGLVDIQQGVGRLINAIVAVLGPELAPGSIFFSRCKSAVAEISCWQETSTMLESARFTQQLVLFAPQAVSVHSHVQTLLSTMSSRQPTLRHLAISTLRHLIEKDPASVIVEQIEDNLFFMLDEETDSEIGNLVRTTIMRLLYASCPSCPSHWISVFRKVVLATSMRSIGNNNIAANDNSDGDTLNFGDDEDMVSSSNNVQSYTFQGSVGAANREKYLRYRTRLFAAECLSHLPEAVGRNPAHFDLLLARKEHANEQAWLVLHLQELISLAYQISTIQFESMQPVGVGLLGTIVDKFEKAADPELPGHLLLEQYQAQLVSAVRTTLDTSSSPSLLEAGLHLATKTQKLSKSMVLAFVLIGYKCIREASTEVCLSEAIDMANSTSSLLKKVFDYESEPDDNILSLSKMFGSCLSMVVALTKDCIEGLHSQEVKSFNQRKLLQKKLAFSLEQHILIAKLALEVEHVEEGKERNPIYVSALSYCIRCIQTVLSDSNIQVQVIGLQFLKAKVQRSKNTEDDSFLMFLVGELITDIFTLIQKMLKNPITRESVTIACECLSLMVLFQTLQKDDDCQRGFMSILLAAIVMVFLSTGDGFSQEVTDLRSTAIKLVSHLAQIPSSSVHFKDVLLSMPPLHRQQLQGVIRASVTQHNNPAELKMPVLDIKIPKPASRNEEEHSAPLPTTTQTGEINKEDVVSEDDVSEDDWDTFQSFPVTTDDGGNESKVEHASVDGDPSVVKTSFDMDGSVGADESQECSASEHDDNENKLNSDEFLEAVKEEVISDTPNQPSFNRLKTEQYDIQTDDDANKPYYNENQERDEALQSSGVQNEAESIPRDEPVSLDYQADVEAKGSTEDFGADYLQKDYIPEPVSDSLAFQQGFSESDFNENANKENRINEDDSYDQQQGKCDSPVETEHIGAKQYDIQTNAVANKPDDNESKEEEEIKQSSGVQSEAESIRGDEQVPHDHQSKVEPKGSIEDLGAAVHLQKVDIPEQVVSDSLALKQDSREKDCYDQHQGKCESPVESEHISTKLESPVEHEEE